MKRSLKRILIWSPRILGILFALFISLFALDVFGEGVSIGEAIVAFLIHLTPVYFLALGVALGWRWAWVGAAIFLGFAVVYVMMSWGAFPISVYWLIAGPAALIGLLFLADWLYPAELRAGAG